LLKGVCFKAVVLDLKYLELFSLTNRPALYDAAKQERFRKFFVDHGAHKKTKIFRILETSEPTQDNKDSNDNKNPEKREQRQSL